ncbi:MAG: ABC transporter permease [Polyangiaceae bacterium]|nr:ABC transporter permease [Polyangiaceae bacterium]
MKAALVAARTVAGRLLLGVATVWALATLVFLSLRLLPGDPAALVLGDLATAEERAALRRSLHLDEPLLAQYGRFLWGIARLDLGASLRHPTRGAFALALEAFWPTASFSLVAVSMGAVFGTAAGGLSASRLLGGGRRLVHAMTLGVAAIPLLGLAPVATYALAVRARALPLPGDPDAGVAGALFAATLLALPLGAQVARATRAALRELGRAQFLTVAKAKGAGELRVLALHALPAVSGPILTVIGTQLGALLGGAIVLERLFERPGLGTVMIQAYAARDLPVLEAGIVASGALFVLTQALFATLHAAVDPRVRRA